MEWIQIQMCAQLSFVLFFPLCVDNIKTSLEFTLSMALNQTFLHICFLDIIDFSNQIGFSVVAVSVDNHPKIILAESSSDSDDILVEDSCRKSLYLLLP